ncbi:MAG: hypothetical protein QOH86_585, partial [Sphingomonadales bacterium]|nr:hypothetical protein [Sphingomonadales bacterium]
GSMRLLFIHGINQESFTEQGLLTKWSRILTNTGFDSVKLAAAKPEMAFYGDILHQLSSGAIAAQSMSASVAELSGTGQAELEFIQAGLDEIAEERGFSQGAIDAAARRTAEEFDGAAVVIPMSTRLGRFAVGVLRLLDEIASPLRDTALSSLKQAYAYLNKPGVRPAIDDRVRPRIGTGELVIVCHSLGTIVAFHLLGELAKGGVQVNVPLLITMGSPLGGEAVKKYVDLPHKMPANVQRWENYFDPGDPVALGKRLSMEFAQGIIDVADINNQTGNAHSIEGYLNQKSIQDSLARAI